MDDSFFNVASNLDKLLDDLEKEECSKEKNTSFQQSTPIRRNSNLSKENPNLSLDPVYKQYSSDITSDSYDKNGFKTLNKLNDNKLVDINENKEKKSSLSHKDQLIKVSQDESKSDCMLKSSSSATRNCPVLNEESASNHMILREGQVIKNDKDVSEVINKDINEVASCSTTFLDDLSLSKDMENIPREPGESDDYPSISVGDVIGFNNEIQIDENEFEQFMNESSFEVSNNEVVVNPKLRKYSAKSQNNRSQSNVLKTNPFDFLPQSSISNHIEEYFPKSAKSIDDIFSQSTILNSATSIEDDSDDQYSSSQTSSADEAYFYPVDECPPQVVTEQQLPSHETEQQVPSDKIEKQSQSYDISTKDSFDTLTQINEELPSTSMASNPVEESSTFCETADVDTTNMVRPGSAKPDWVHDRESSSCSYCNDRFTFTRRKHHCRSCGKIFCNSCCSAKARLAYLNFEEARVCIACKSEVDKVDAHHLNQILNPTITQKTSEPQSILNTGRSSSSMSKFVRFSDGTRPDHPQGVPKTPPLPPKITKSRSLKEPKPTDLPPVVEALNEDSSFSVYDTQNVDDVNSSICGSERRPLIFALSSNLFIAVKLVTYHAVSCYYFLSSGLNSVGQSEVGLLLEDEDNKLLTETFLVQIFKLFAHLFLMGRKGKFCHPMQIISCYEFLDESNQLFGNPANHGILFVKPNCHDFSNLEYENSGLSSLMYSKTNHFLSTLFGLVIHKSETSWANLFPNRLLLGLGYKLSECPYPIRNKLSRKSLYPVVGNSILSILCDFRNYKYRVITIPGLIVLVDSSKVVVNFPNNRLDDVLKVIRCSNDHVLTFGSSSIYSRNHSSSTLVCIQDEDNSYKTEVLQKEPHQDTLTSAAFVTINGSLKSGDSCKVKTSIVEDGVMIQLLPETMDTLKNSIKLKENFLLKSNDSETRQGCCVEINWIEDHTEFNVGISSPVDFQSLEGVVGYNVSKCEKKSKSLVLRWNQVFCFKSTISGSDVSQLAELIGSTASQALLSHLKVLKASNQVKFAIRATVHPDNVGYLAGSNGLPLPNTCLDSLDNYLIPLLHQSSSSLNNNDDPVVFEMIFSILEVNPTWKYSN